MRNEPRGTVDLFAAQKRTVLGMHGEASSRNQHVVCVLEEIYEEMNYQTQYIGSGKTYVLNPAG